MLNSAFPKTIFEIILAIIKSRVVLTLKRQESVEYFLVENYFIMVKNEYLVWHIEEGLLNKS